MKVAIVTLTTTARRTGVAEYLINLLDQLQQIAPGDEFFVFTSRDNRYMFKLLPDRSTEIVLPFSHTPLMRFFFHAWLIFVLPLWVRKKNVDVVHLPNTMLVTGFFRTVITIHDIVELRVKKYGRLRTFLRRLMVLSAIRNAVAVITVSKSTASDLVSLSPIHPHVIHLGFIDPYIGFSPSVPDQVILDKYRLSEVKFVIFIGTIMRHKNIPALIKAFEISQSTNPDLQLVLVGAPDNDYQAATKAARTSISKSKIHFLNFVPHDEKLVLLRNASVFCMPSAYEGFGIPILESQAAGVPVVCNNISSLPEVGGEGQILVDPENLVIGTSLAIEKVLSDTTYREHLIAAGKRNLARFSWQKTALETMKVYKMTI